MKVKWSIGLLVLFVPSIAWPRVAAHPRADALFQTAPGGTISGRVFDASGKPAFQIEVRIMPADQVITDSDAVFSEHRLYTYVGQDGTYTIQWVRPGRYIVAVNADFRHEYPTTYYPGVQDLSRARQVRVREGEQLTNVDVDLPSPSLDRWKLEGTVVWPDGRPALAATVSLLMARYPWIAPYSLDTSEASHSASFTVYGYTKYEYYVTAYATNGDKEQMHAEPQLVSAAQTSGVVQLVLTSPGRICTHVRPKRDN